ncbi:MAG: hypothetical protein L0Y54_18585 [Sporichthyaceae bacterium]|nr:hypothetical protein [Sporichthyaceae bacterium]
MSTEPTSQPKPPTGWEVIHTYTRAQALADGVLIAADPAMVRDARLRYPVALTAAAWADCVAWTDADNDRKDTCQDEAARLWDVLWMTRHAISRHVGHTQRQPVQLERVPRRGPGVLPRTVTLHVVIGPGDHAEPVLTIMLPDED